jgi:hypothetical protein
MDKTF